jgi:hypothetical protein
VNPVHEGQQANPCIIPGHIGLGHKPVGAFRGDYGSIFSVHSYFLWEALWLVMQVRRILLKQQ